MTKTICPNCRAENPENSKFCFKCGQSIAASEPVASAAPEDTAFCPTCGASNPAGSKFCYVCGNSMNAAKAVSEPRETASVVSSGANKVAGAAAGAVASVSNIDWQQKREDASKRMSNILGTDVEQQMSGRGDVDLGSFTADTSDDVKRAFGYFGITLNVSSGSDESDPYVKDFAEAQSALGISDETVYVYEIQGDDKRAARSSSVVDSDGVYARQFASGWAVAPDMLDADTLGKSARKEDLERLRHRVEMGEVSTKEAAVRIDANRHASQH